MDDDNDQENVIEDDDNDPENVIEDDYYTFLNLPRNASPEEIVNAYRKQSKIFHPDKHTDPNKKIKAQKIFTRTKTAYEVLSDPHQRAIYDTLGTQGLKIDGWEMVQRTKTPQEIRAEYERLEEAREEIKLLENTRPYGNITMNINATDIFDRYDDIYNEYSDMFPSIEVSGMSISQSIQTPITIRDRITMYGQLGIHNGMGAGSLNVAAQRNIREGWVELDVGAGNGPTMSLRMLRVLSKRLLCNISAACKMSPSGKKYTLTGSLTMQLGNQTIGSLTYKTGSMSTVIERSTNHKYMSFAIHLNVLNSYIAFHYSYKLAMMQLKLYGSIKAGTLGMTLEYGAEKKISHYDSVSAAVRVGVPNGVTLKVTLKRVSQTYIFPIHLSEEVLPAPIFYATVVPIITWAIVKRFIIDPIERERKEQKKQKQKEVNKAKLLEKQREAKAAVELMKATVSRIRAEEESKKGLIIIKALYGRFVYPQEGRSGTEDIPREEVIDVTIPLQCLVRNSKLYLHSASKSQLPGFYDPCVGETKQLWIQYLFFSETHECIINDNAPLAIPKESHKINTT